MSGRVVPSPSRGFVGDVRHHRHLRRAPPRRFRANNPIIFLGVGAAILTAVAGFALGSLVLGSFSSSPPQSAAYGIPNAPPGVSFVQALATFVNASTVPAAGACTTSNLGTSAAPTALTNGAAVGICLSTSAGGFATGDTIYTLEISWNSTAVNSTIFKVQVSITVGPATNDVSVTSYVKTSATITSSEQAVYAVDLTQAADTSVNSFAVLVTQL